MSKLAEEEEGKKEERDERLNEADEFLSKFAEEVEEVGDKQDEKRNSSAETAVMEVDGQNDAMRKHDGDGVSMQ
jgi:hypothetical protein